MEMEQVPRWLQAAVFAAGMTAYAEEVDASSARGIAADAQGGIETAAGIGTEVSSDGSSETVPPASGAIH